ncbi:MAG TPA: isoprenylcysteine carboxylmethyltransferase family protein [Rubrobacteraceae bacterium]|nr:isoprenylcysteine carboxylmethyltransferase family protein [Rubrobacteraceae bacterium]
MWIAKQLDQPVSIVESRGCDQRRTRQRRGRSSSALDLRYSSCSGPATHQAAAGTVPAAWVGAHPRLVAPWWRALAGGLVQSDSAERRYTRRSTGPTSNLVTNGPYRYTRNPGYLSMALIYAGISNRTSSLWSILLLPVASLVIRYGVIEREERYLERVFGEEYLSYKARVQRWI